MIAPNGQSTAVSHAIDDTDKAVAPDTEPSENSEQTPGDANLRDSDIKVHLRGLNFFYNDTHALHDITLGLEKNQATAFIGPSGCGKSTLLRCINRIYELYPKRRATGEIIIDGRNILAPNEDLNQLRARVGMVFQKPTPFPMTIFDNIAFGVRLYERLPAARLRERVEWALHKANLW
ncbi:MAG TPA: ATP-binding cassette domain-containing protein, partial [Alphaproteobacteria bacterium]|nr:ATP-binding cassette domain-containing protein [Alphaproteobacteria bacterium]